MKVYVIPFLIICLGTTIYLCANPKLVIATKCAIQNSDAPIIADINGFNKYDTHLKMLDKAEIYQHQLEDVFNYGYAINGCYNNTTSRIELYIYRDERHEPIVGDTVQAEILMKYKSVISKYKARLFIDTIYKSDNTHFDIFTITNETRIRIVGNFEIYNKQNLIIANGKYINRGLLTDYLFTTQDSEFSNNALLMIGNLSVNDTDKKPFVCCSDIQYIGLPPENTEFTFGRMTSRSVVKNLPEWEDYNTRLTKKWWEDSTALDMLGL